MGPKTRIRAGSVACALWENEAVINGRSTPVLRATVDRRYKDKDGTWKSSGSFSRNELPLAVYCLLKAFTAMVEHDAGDEDA